MQVMIYNRAGLAASDSTAGVAAAPASGRACAGELPAALLEALRVVREARRQPGRST